MELPNRQLGDHEVAAIVSAAVIELLSSVSAQESKIEQDSTSWRFSGRWWNQPVALGRRRPGVR